MVYNTGSKDDWDHISKVTCDPDWTWDAMAKYWDLNQKYVPPNDGNDCYRLTRIGLGLRDRTCPVPLQTTLCPI
jgi:hypothetical protein